MTLSENRLGWLHHLLFVLRCTAAACLSYVLAMAVGLPYPTWALISALVVSQERLHETGNAAQWRLAGTMTGIALAVLVGAVLTPFHVPVPVQLFAAVAVAAAVVRRWKEVRASMWTVAIIFFSDSSHAQIWQVGVWRAVEVLLGGVVGAALHYLAEAVMTHVEKSLEPEPLASPLPPGAEE